ncbi:MAG: hypothetical protein JSU90_10600 [Nitrospiraceae bacterium]|nr:MAG: hypothetical protein JSU90_10600 [Nitrospiraceae bacterium]
MIKNKVVVRYKDGTLEKGHAIDFFPNKVVFHLEHDDGTTEEIQTEKLKAIFFVKDFIGDKQHEKMYRDMIPGGGRKMQVTFLDGETIIGYSQGYSPDRRGFFVIPADKDDNNERIYVVVSATQTVTFL